MCGISGIVYFDGRGVDLRELRRVNDALAHRGPDGSGLHCEGPIGIGHRRLAIIDPVSGQQPFYSDDRRIVLSFNGEIYNYLEIRAELGSRCEFRTASDTEVLLRAYETWGMECLSRFRGMFAFALYDAGKQRLFLVRDRVGVKPLYYARQGQDFAFASELEALLELEWLDREVDREALAQYFRYIYVPSPLTIYRGVRKLEPGHYLEVDTGSGQSILRQYWDLRVRHVERSEGEWLEALASALDECVRLYVRSDVPFGAFLSGGVDSSLVTALMTRVMHERVRTFTIGFDDPAYSEADFARRAGDVLGTQHRESTVSSSVDMELLRRIARCFGEPFADSSAVPTFYVSERASREVKMVLSGDGGDELFGGYDSYAAVVRRLSAADRSAAGGLRAAMARWMRPAPARGVQRLHDGSRTLFSDAQIRALLPGIELPDRVRPPAAALPGEGALTRFQAEDFKLYLHDDVLTKVDRMSMANSLEVRVPLLDHELVELAFSVPENLKVRADAGTVTTKYLLKRSAERFLPCDLLHRRKQGFGVPIAKWFSGALVGDLRARFEDPGNPVFGIVDRKGALDVLRPVLSGAPTGSPASAWALLMLDLWFHEVHRARRHATA